MPNPEELKEQKVDDNDKEEADKCDVYKNGVDCKGIFFIIGKIIKDPFAK